MNYINYDFSTEEGINEAFKSGFRLDQYSPVEIRSNPDILNIAIAYDVNQINFGTIESLTDKNINKALTSIDDLYFPSDETPDIIWYFIIKNLKNETENTGLWILYLNDIPSKFITNELIDDIVKTALESNYQLHRIHNILSNSHTFIKESIQNNPEIINFALGEALTNDNIELALENGYALNAESPTYFRNDENIIKKSIKNRYRSIKFVNSECLNQDIIEYALKVNAKSLDFLNIEYLTEDNINLALNNGYYINNFTPKIIKDNLNFIKKSIENNLKSIIYIDSEILKNNPDIIRSSIKSNARTIDYLHDEDLVDEYLNLALENNYTLSRVSPKKLKNNPDVLKSSICIDINSINYALENALTYDNVKFAIDNGYIITIYSSDIILENSNVNQIFLEKLNLEYDKSVTENYIKNYGAPYTYIGLKSGVFSQQILDEFGDIAQNKIFKYLILSKKIDNIYKYIDSNELALFRYIYTVISDSAQPFLNFDSVLFENVLKKYNKYKTISLQVISKNKKLMPKLKRLYTMKQELNITNLEELENINEIIYEDNVKKINDATDITELKDVIFLALFNEHYSDIQEILEKIINSEKCDKLLESIKDESVRLEIEKLKSIIGYIEKIYSMHNKEDLLNLATIINQNNFENKNLNYLFQNIEKIANYFYTMDINENIKKIDKIEESEFIKIVNDTYYSNNKIYGINSGEIEIGRKEVKLIEINENANFLAHVINAFGKFGKITDWKKPRLIGSTHLCLSAINNNIRPLKIKVEDIDTGIILLFDHINEGSLVKLASYDMYSSTYNNDLDVSTYDYNFNTLKEILNNTVNYNEYVVYRENLDGTNIYPSAVMIRGEVPLQAEIDAAAYLGIPLVKLSKTRKKDDDLNDDKKGDISKNNTNIVEKEQVEKIIDYILANMNMEGEMENDERTR